MQERIQSILAELRAYSLEKQARVGLLWHQEKSHFVRYANSAISLNTTEELCRLQIIAYGEKRKAETEVMADPADLARMKAMIDEALAMLEVADEMSFQPTVPQLSDSSDTRCYDPALAQITSEEIIDFVAASVSGLESEDIRLSGNFSMGETRIGWTSTESEGFGYWAATDAQITLVLSSLRDKWEVNAEQSAVRKSDLNAQSLHEQLSFLVKAYLESPARQLPLAPYRIVLGPAALAEYIQMLNYIAFDGDGVMREMGMHRLTDQGKKIFSDAFSLIDDPGAKETFAIDHDLYGRKRDKRSIYEKGILRDFAVIQAVADEFGIPANGSDVPHLNLCLEGGEADITDLADLREAAKDGDILYIPYIHYVGVVNPSEGLITGSSRFGALLFKQDGSLEVPYNVRLTQRLTDLFSQERLLWMSRERVAYNVSQTYDARNPQAVLVPKFCALDQVEIAHSNESY